MTVAGLVDRHLANSTDVFLHHGRDFRQFLRYENVKARHAIQVFRDEEVPHDTRSLSSLLHCNYY